LISLENPGVPEEVCHDDILRAADVVLDDFEVVLFIGRGTGEFGIGIAAGDVAEAARVGEADVDPESLSFVVVTADVEYLSVVRCG
jgi:predicted RNA methylase